MTPDLSKQRGEFEAWLQSVAAQNPAGLSDDFISAARAGWQAASQAAGERERELREALRHAHTYFIQNSNLTDGVIDMLDEMLAALGKGEV